MSSPHLDGCGGGEIGDSNNDRFNNDFKVDNLEKKTNVLCPKGARRVERSEIKYNQYGSGIINKDGYLIDSNSADNYGFINPSKELFVEFQ